MPLEYSGDGSHPAELDDTHSPHTNLLLRDAGPPRACRQDVPLEYSGEEQSICAVGLVRPRPGVFVEAIQHLLVLCTTTEASRPPFLAVSPPLSSFLPAGAVHHHRGEPAALFRCSPSCFFLETPGSKLGLGLPVLSLQPRDVVRPLRQL